MLIPVAGRAAAIDNAVAGTAELAAADGSNVDAIGAAAPHVQRGRMGAR
jgi:hypothetical protein